MKSYGQFCPVAKASELFCERWTPLIIRDLAAGATRFSEIRRGVPLMSPTILTRRLKQLEAEGVLERCKSESGRGFTYHLTKRGLEFVPMIELLGVWGQRWSRRDLVDNEIDLGLLIWTLERSVNASAFTKKRTVVQLHIPDQPLSKAVFWFLNEGSNCQLCIEDPGHDVDLYVKATLPDLIYIVRGDLPLKKAMASERLEVIGTASARRSFRNWLNLGPLAAIPSARPPVSAAAE